MDKLKKLSIGLKSNIIKLVFVLIFLAPFLLIRKSLEREIKKCHKLSKGRVTDISYSRSGGGLLYEYSVNDHILKGTYGATHYQELLGKEFPVIYSCEDSSYAHMLIYPDDFKKYGYKFPDSLKWVLPIIE